MNKVSPSLLAADFSCLGDEVRRITGAGADWLHLDVMDGVFVPNISFGAPVIQSLRRHCPLRFDVHLMIREPLRYIGDFVRAGAGSITFHLESCSNTGKALDAIHTLGQKAGIAIKPETPVKALLPFLPKLDMVLVMSVEPGFGGQKFMAECLPKIRAIRKAAPELDISVDGGINAETGRLAVEAGANILVAGSYVFGAQDAAGAIRSLRFDPDKPAEIPGAPQPF